MITEYREQPLNTVLAALRTAVPCPRCESSYENGHWQLVVEAYVEDDYSDQDDQAVPRAQVDLQAWCFTPDRSARDSVAPPRRCGQKIIGDLVPSGETTELDLLLNQIFQLAIQH